MYNSVLQESLEDALKRDSEVNVFSSIFMNEQFEKLQTLFDKINKKELFETLCDLND